MKKSILFRPSEIGKIMGSAKGKSNREKYDDLEEMIQKVELEFSELKNKETKKAESLLERANRYKGEKESLEDVKDLPHLPETCKKQMRSKMIEIKFNRFKEIETKYMRKGKEVEEAGITLYSLIQNKIFENNKIRVQNDYFSGEIDIPWKDNDDVVYRISDIKSSWSIHTFYDNEEVIKKDNKYQGDAYLDLYPSAKDYSIANVLIDTPFDMILNELYRESFKWKDQETPNWRELQIVKDHIFSKDKFDEFVDLRGCTPHDEKSQKIYDSFISLEQDSRLIEHTYSRNEDDIQKIKDRCDECRLYLEMTYGLIHVS